MDELSGHPFWGTEPGAAHKPRPASRIDRSIAGIGETDVARRLYRSDDTVGCAIGYNRRVVGQSAQPAGLSHLLVDTSAGRADRSNSRAWWGQRCA
jgi:hypothetical protein